jgi:hypothetical protein
MHAEVDRVHAPELSVPLFPVAERDSLLERYIYF